MNTDVYLNALQIAELTHRKLVTTLTFVNEPDSGSPPLDLPTWADTPAADNPQVWTGLGTGSHIRSSG
jgi:hypothetical protein